MDVRYETIQPKFEQIKHFITNDLQLVTKSPIGGNYTAALLIACACETLAWFRHGRQHIGDQFFRNMMLPERWKPVSKSLYGALRDGLAHAFETKKIKIGAKEFEIGVSWSEHPHLTFNENQSVFYMNVQTMANDLRSAVERYEGELKSTPKARSQFSETMRKMRDGFIEDVSNRQAERSAWDELMK